MVAQKLYWRMVWQVSLRVAGHIRSFPGKVLGVFFVLTCMFLKFRWMLSGLRTLKRKKSPPQSVADLQVKQKNVS